MQHFTTWAASESFICGADAVGRRNSAADTNPLLTTCRECKQTEAWAEALQIAQTPVPTIYKIIGENVLTGNSWDCVTGLDDRADAVFTLKGWRRLESNPHIEYRLEEQH